jgi:hypothetical protein
MLTHDVRPSRASTFFPSNPPTNEKTNESQEVTVDNDERPCSITVTAPQDSFTDLKEES